MNPTRLEEAQRRSLLKRQIPKTQYLEVWIPNHVWESITQHLRHRSRGRWLREVTLARWREHEDKSLKFSSYRAHGTVRPGQAHRAKVPFSPEELEALRQDVGNLSRFVAGAAEAQVKKNKWGRTAQEVIMTTRITVTTHGAIGDSEALHLAAKSIAYWQADIDKGETPPAQGLISFSGGARTCIRRTLTGWSVIVEQLIKEEEC